MFVSADGPAKSGGSRTAYAVTIPTLLPIRQSVLTLLLVQIARQAPAAPLTVSPHNDDEPARNDCVRALRLGAQLRCPWTVYLEDDAYLAPVFDYVVRVTLTMAEDEGQRLVSFYSDNRRVLRAAAEGRTTCILPASYLWSSVCIAVRSGDVESIAEFAPQWYASHREHWHASDLLLRAWCASRGSDVLVAVPSPVQHRDPPSTLGHHVTRRRYSRTFRRAYGPVPSSAVASLDHDRPGDRAGDHQGAHRGIPHTTIVHPCHPEALLEHDDTTNAPLA